MKYTQYQNAAPSSSTTGTDFLNRTTASKTAGTHNTAAAANKGA